MVSILTSSLCFQIDEFLQTGTLSALKKEEDGQEKKESKDADMALKFI